MLQLNPNYAVLRIPVKPNARTQFGEKIRGRAEGTMVVRSCIQRGRAANTEEGKKEDIRWQKYVIQKPVRRKYKAGCGGRSTGKIGSGNLIKF